jgi:hypothetical protein
MKNKKLGFWHLLLLAMLLNILSQALHEGGHWAAYQLYGHKPVWGFTAIVQLWDTPPLHPQDWTALVTPQGEPYWLRMASPAGSRIEGSLSAAAGPLASLLGAVICLVVAARAKNVRLRQAALLMSLSISLTMGLYYLRSPMRTGGDESDVAYGLGIARIWIELPLAAGFVACLILGIRSLSGGRERWTWLGAALLGSLATGLPLALVDPLVRAQVNLDNPFFRPVLGFSLPVLVVNGLALLLVVVWLVARRNRAEPGNLK